MQEITPHIHNVVELIAKVGDLNYPLAWSDIDKALAKDFVMIAQNKKTCDYQGLIKHFDHIQKQTGNWKINVYETILTPEKQIIRYTLTTEHKGTGHVIAIFKYRPGESLAYEMNEVFNTGDHTLDVSV